MANAGKPTSEITGKDARKSARKSTDDMAPLAEDAQLEASPAPRRSARRVKAVERQAIILSDLDRSRLCQESRCSLTTIRMWAGGYHVHAANAERLDRAMAKLGIPRRPRSEKKRRRIVDVQRVA